MAAQTPRGAAEPTCILCIVEENCRAVVEPLLVAKHTIPISCLYIRKCESLNCLALKEIVRSLDCLEFALQSLLFFADEVFRGKLKSKFDSWRSRLIESRFGVVEV